MGIAEIAQVGGLLPQSKHSHWVLHATDGGNNLVPYRWTAGGIRES